jgi:hypothetical protein
MFISDIRVLGRPAMYREVLNVTTYFRAVEPEDEDIRRGVNLVLKTVESALCANKQLKGNLPKVFLGLCLQRKRVHVTWEQT